MRKLLAGLLVFIFIPLFLVVFLSFNLQSIILNKEEVKDSLEKSDFYERLVPSLVDDLYSTNIEIDLVTDDELASLMDTTFPPEAVKSEVEKTIDQVYPYLLSETDTLAVTYDLKGYKETFLKEAEKLLLAEIKSLPKCNSQQLRDLDLENSDKLPACKPPSFTDEEIREAVVNGDFDDLLAAVPDEIKITETEIISKPPTMELEDQEPTEEIFVNIREVVSYLDKIILTSFAGLLIILIFISLLRWGSYKSMSKWIGWTLLISVVNFALISFLIYYSASSAEGALQGLNQTAAITTSSIADLMRKMFFNRTLPQTIILLIISLALIFIPRFIKSKQKQETIPQPQP